MELLKFKYKSLEEILTGSVTVGSLGSFNIENIPIIPVLFQTGYLTIKEFTLKPIRYKLGFPNEEVRISFEKNLMAVFTHLDESQVDKSIDQKKL